MKKLLIIFVLALFLTSSVMAFMPATHYHIWEEGQREPVDSNLYRSCDKYPELCYTGNILSDVSVIYYYTNFDRYTVTHSPSFCRALLDSANTDIEQACAVGGCSHQPHDMVSHNTGVPHAIRSLFLPNSVIHTFEEQHVDNYVLSIDPDARVLGEQSLQSFEQCIPLFQRVLEGEEKYQGVDLTAMFTKFVDEVTTSQTGYDVKFSNLAVIPLLVLVPYIAAMLFFLALAILIIIKRLRFRDRRTWFNWISLVIVLMILGILALLFMANLGGRAFDTFIFVIKPISNFVPAGDIQGQLNTAISNHVAFMKAGESFLISKFNEGIIASGKPSLDAADASIRVGQWAILFTIVVALVVFIWLNFRRSKKYSNVPAVPL